MSIISELLSPFDYLRIRHPLKRVVDYWSVGIAVCASLIVYSAWPALNVFGPSGLLSGLNGVLAILPGFFITCLAAIATFSGAAYRIDDRFEGEAAILDGEPLTRRQFLCHLFAYVSLLSLMLYFLGVFAVAAATSPHGAFLSTHRVVIHLTYEAIYAGILGNIFGVTLIGLVFLSSRMTRVSPRDRFIVRAKDSKVAEETDETR